MFHTAAEKEPFEAEAKVDQERYKKLMISYRSGAGQAGPVADEEGSGSGSASDDE